MKYRILNIYIMNYKVQQKIIEEYELMKINNRLRYLKAGKDD